VTLCHENLVTKLPRCP